MHSPHLFSFLKQFPRSIWVKSALLALLAIGGSLPSSAKTGPASQQFNMLREPELRVAIVAYRLSLANVSLCDRVLTAQLGFVVQSRDGGVLSVVPGSEAAFAGIVTGDQIESVNGRDVKHVSVNVPQIPGRADSVEPMLIEAMRGGTITLRVSAAGQSRELQFRPALGCPANVELVRGLEVNAWADGSRVIMSEGLLAKCATDDDLALVIGHEMAHNLLHHRRRLAAEGVTAPTLLPMTEALTQKVRETEEEADRVGVNLATRAGYDLASAERFMADLLDPAVPVAATHPARHRRLLLLHTAIMEARHGRDPRVAFRGEVLPPS